MVAAPSKLQRPAGDRVKTDAKDALHLARLLKLGEVTGIRVPSQDQEAARDLVRSREDLRGDLMRSRHRISKLLLRQGIVYSGGQAWTGTHELWLARQRFDAPARQLTYESSLEAMHEISDRRDRLDQAITSMAYSSEYTPVVRALQCLRGISTLTAFGLAVEIGDWGRFTGSTIGAYLGLVPTEHSSGQSRSLGSITKTGNSHARRLLVEAAWHHRRPYNNPPRLRHAGNRRLHERWISYLENAASARSSPMSPSPASSPPGAGQPETGDARHCWTSGSLQPNTSFHHFRYPQLGSVVELHALGALG
ncbi:IS110 family transposase [Paenarthrobacter sp. RAF54_2]